MNRIYCIWKSMKHRCSSKDVRFYKYYGSKGIVVCSEWLDFKTFKRWALSNGYADGLTIDRKDPEMGYNPDNCRWTDGFGQAKSKINTRKIVWEGKIYSTGELAKKVGIQRDTINNRLRLGWSVEEAITVPEKKNFLFFRGKKTTLPKIAKQFGIKYDTLHNRVTKLRWPIEKAIRN